MSFKNLPAWAKGGISLVTVDALFWIVFVLWASQPGGSDLAGLAVVAGIYYGLISLIPAFGIGALIGSVVCAITKSKANNSRKGLKIGFSLSLIIILTYFALYEIYYLSSYGTFHIDRAPVTIIIPITFIAISSLIGWLIGKFR